MQDYNNMSREFGSLWSAVGKKLSIEDVADEFSHVTTYQTGKLTIYRGRLYQCTSEHHGEWDEGHFKRTTIGAYVSSIAESVYELRREVSRMQDSAQLRGQVETHRHGTGGEHACVSIDMIAPAYKSGKKYRPGFMVSRGSKLYCCICGHVSSPDFDKSKWIETTVSEMVDGFTSAVSEMMRRKFDESHNEKHA